MPGFSVGGGGFGPKHAHTLRTYMVISSAEEKGHRDEWISAVIDTLCSNIKVNECVICLSTKKRTELIHSVTIDMESTQCFP